MCKKDFGVEFYARKAPNGVKLRYKGALDGRCTNPGFVHGDPPEPVHALNSGNDFNAGKKN
ncbi:hypothetical protein GGTG_11860 [Gaeumannomyces tritici R3-111a-1]|uniref:Uncharacterized protein n=1 Tax=Gaeumannomyces tritici (strain R3-111a-1) TaxID=644352 RepID=J3PED0_GAET3|nr:hypothetical protein GGTG_11860 [Gaeumannomyces tritici R3-111a-1]EJT70837.1 hypothetical protein GGTG_11860 [Gaeumannomyces tritici R3-111a-1]